MAAIIAGSLSINMLVAAISWFAIPVMFDKMMIDPALAGSVILTSVNDMVGFFIFLGSVSLLLV